MRRNNRKAVVLLSGGLDSATVLAIAKKQGFRCYALTIGYNQRHKIELEKAQAVSQDIGVYEHKIMDVDLSAFGHSALTDNIDVPKNKKVEDISKNIPITYVPARNTVFLSLALAWAEVLGAWDVFIGVNALDYSGYPDCREEFIEAFEHMAKFATKAGVEGGNFKIHTPLLHMNKAQIILKGVQLGVRYKLTHSCYDPHHDGQPCGFCDSCLLRKKGFEEAGLTDPALDS
ncbi:MAG: 7-cyano-7-deazaguanine synthase QueC [Deltaproteobacteria bacterium]|nr:7-cyano-7-deazaguanine synthase QueC [Deltaproteobacteria bacterium]